jgi:hypothetical protein
MFSVAMGKPIIFNALVPAFTPHRKTKLWSICQIILRNKPGLLHLNSKASGTKIAVNW